MRKVILAVLVLSVMACAGPAPGRDAGGGQQASGGTARPKYLVAAVRSSPNLVFYSKLNLASAGLGTNDFQQLLNAGLVRTDLPGVLYPQLAEATPTIENGLWRVFPDGRMETTWKIQPGAQWHDGTPFTTDDLLFTTTLVRDRSIPVFRDIAFDSIDAVEALDAATIVVKWKQPYIEADTLFTYSHALPLPRHLLEKQYLEDKEGLLQQHPYWGPEFVGTGAFRLQEFVLDSRVVFAANDRYVLGRPKIDTIEVRFFPDPNTVMANMLAGEVAYAFDARTLSLEQGVQLRDNWAYGKLQLAPGSWVTIFTQYLDPSPAVVANPQFRRALITATDRQAMVDTLQYGLSAIAHIWIDPTRAEYQAAESDIVRYPYDPARAAQIVEGLGYRKGPDGAFRDPAGQPLNVELRTSVTDINVKATTAVADYWQRLGVGVSQEIVAPQRAQDRPYRATFPAFELIRPGNAVTAFQNWHSNGIPTAANNWVGDNRSRYTNPGLDALIERYFVTIPIDERTGILRQVLHLFTDLELWMGLFYDPSVVMVGDRMVNVIPGTLYNVHEWDLR